MNSKSLKMNYLVRNKFLYTFILLFSAICLFISLIILVKYFLLNLSGIQEPVLNWIKTLLSKENIMIQNLFEFTTIFKLAGLFFSGGFIFLFYIVFSTVLSCIFYNFCSRKYRKIMHPLKYSIISGIKWNIYRTFLVMTPPLFIKWIGIILFFSSIILFNWFLKIAGISLSLTAFSVSFITFSLIFLFVFSLLISAWQLFSTIFGTEIAISEPKLSFSKIENRSRKLIFFNRYNMFLCSLFLILILSIVFQAKYILATNLFANPANKDIINAIIIFNLLFIITFEYLKSYGYINSLIKYNYEISKCPMKIIKS